MARSFQKTIAFGKSKRGAQSRNKTWNDYDAQKAIKEGTPIYRQHGRFNLQTLQDFIDYVNDDCAVNSIFNDMYDRRNYRQLQNALKEGFTREDFAKKLFNKYRSK